MSRMPYQMKIGEFDPGESAAALLLWFLWRSFVATVNRLGRVLPQMLYDLHDDKDLN